MPKTNKKIEKCRHRWDYKGGKILNYRPFLERRCESCGKLQVATITQKLNWKSF
jgi:hypothetical protein